MRRYKPEPHPKAEAVRNIIRKVFADLRKEGAFCRMNFEDCQSCAGSMIPAEAPYAYYHGQDNERLTEAGSVYIAYGAQSDNDFDEREWATKLATAMQKAGALVNWNGDLRTRMQITVA